MKIAAKTVTTTISSSFSINRLNDVHVSYDDPIYKVLRITIPEAVPPQVLVISGEEYEALGQWTDATLNATIMAKYGLEEVI